MRYLAAYLLAQLGGTSRPQESDIKNILSSVGIECEQERANLVVSQMHGKNMHDLISAGKEKMGGLSFGVAPAADTGATAASAPSEATKPESKAPAAPVEEKEESEESDADMGFSLFD